MTVKYKTVITKAGAIKLAAATVPNGKKVNFTAMAIGDGGGTLPEPDASQTKLVNEVWRHTLNKISLDNKHQNYVIAELLIPPETGGFWMREMGLYDDTGTLIAVGNMAESYKPKLEEGSGRAQTVRMVIMVSDIESVELTIDTSTVMATQDYVDDKLAEHEQSRRHPDATLKEKGFTQLSSATDSSSETLAATPKAVKAAYDLANGKYTAQDATTAQKGIVQLSSATDSASESVAATSKSVKIAMDNAGARLAKDRNLSDLTNLAVARQNLELGNSSTRNIGVMENTVAAGDDSRITGAMQKTQNGADIQDVQMFIQNLGMKETLNPSKRVSIGALGAGLFDGSKPSINIGDSDSGFIFESDGVIGIYANNQKIAKLTNTGIKSFGYMTILSGALILDNDTYFLRHSSADNAGFSGNNIELASWNGIGFPCTYDQITRIYLNTRTGEIGLTGDLKAGGNVYSGSNAWLDQTGNLQGSAWGAGVGLKQYIANQLATQKSYIDNGFNKKNTASLAVNGWHKDESTGIITQWGSGNTTTIGANVTFPIPFPNVCTSITSNERNNNITPVIINFSGVGKTGFTVQAWNNNAARVDSSISWVATGY
ncbi:TPA: phage tail protein [Enterobacter chuandaensis]